MAISHLNLYSLNPSTPSLHSKTYLSSISTPPPPPPPPPTHFNSQSSLFLIPPRISSSHAFKFPRWASPHHNNPQQNIFPHTAWWHLRNYSEHQDQNDENFNSVTVWGFLRKMLELLSNYHWILFLAFASLAVAAVADINIPRLLAAAVFSAQRGETAAFYGSVRLLVVLCLASGVTSGLRSGCFAIANVILLKRLRESLYSTLIFQDITFFDTIEASSLTSRIGADCQRLSNVIGNDINLIVRNIIQGTGALINLLSLSWPLAMSSLIICCVMGAIFSVYGQYQKKAAKLSQDFAACANQVAEETLSLIKGVRVHGTESLERGRYKCWLERLAFISVRESVANGLWNMSFSTLYRLMQIFAVLLGGMSIMTGHLSTEQLTKYVLYCEWLIYATWRVVNNLSSLLQAIGGSEKVFQLMQLSPSAQFLSKDSSNADCLSTINRSKIAKAKGRNSVCGCIFLLSIKDYGRAFFCQVPVLEHLDLSIQANEVIAVVGLSGSGKTTLVNLLLRLYEPVDGQIYMDGLSINQLDIRWLRENIGYVEQEPRLFHMDVKSNITYGCHRDIKKEDIEWAAKLAYAHEFISCLPDAYETLIDDKLLSGGQKQRIAIARAFLRNPAVLILDEATSALDSESEHFVKEVIHMFKNQEKWNRSIIVIAHRLSTIEAADRIIVMDGGRIMEFLDNIM